MANEITPHIKAHEHTIANYREIMRSKTCGCCYCMSIFPPSDIIKEEHTCFEPGKNDLTVFCPYCSIDAVFGDASGFKPTKALLEKMYNYWF